ncbi:chromate efflux transporter [Colwellia sp. MEBiC06753]
MNKYFEIFYRFIQLGCISFGGPVAHIGYFQQAFVSKYQWLDNQSFARTIALCQFLPGPTSSQLGFAIGYQRAGVLGAIAAFIGFTTPSLVLMLLLYFVGQKFADTLTFVGIVHGLKLLAAVVVIDAILTMAKAFGRSWLHKSLMLISAITLIYFSSSLIQMVVLIVSGVIGFVSYRLMQGDAEQAIVAGDNKNLIEGKKAKVLNQVNWLALGLFAFLFLGSLLFSQSVLVGWFYDFYYAGSLVFGGGHVVLPLLQQTVADQLNPELFLTGYAAAQAVPGPMFSIATYLGANLNEQAPVITALIATLAIFLPGFLLYIAFQQVWHNITQLPALANTMAAINAAVVGFLIAAFYNPIAVSAIQNNYDLLAVAVGFILLKFAKIPIVILVASFATVGVLMSQIMLT